MTSARNCNPDPVAEVVVDSGKEWGVRGKGDQETSWDGEGDSGKESAGRGKGPKISWNSGGDSDKESAGRGKGDRGISWDSETDVSGDLATK